mgnify:CR=1 FL=1
MCIRDRYRMSTKAKSTLIVVARIVPSREVPPSGRKSASSATPLSLIHISEPTRPH